MKNLIHLIISIVLQKELIKCDILDYSERTWPAQCLKGVRQSPIDFSKTIRYNTTSDYVYLDSMNYTPITNVSFSLISGFKYGAATTKFGSVYMVKNGIKYKFDLLELHFHAPTEHLFGGIAYDMEMHIVHKKDLTYLQNNGITDDPDEDYSLLLIGVAYQSNTTVNNSIIDQLNLHTLKNITSLDLTGMISISKPFYFYTGSLTFPGCDRIVNWLVFEEPEPISYDQAREIYNWVLKTYPNGDARHVKQLNGRTVYKVTPVPHLGGNYAIFNFLTTVVLVSTIFLIIL